MLEFLSLSLVVGIIPIVLNLVISHGAYILSYLYTHAVSFGHATRKITHSISISKSGARLISLDDDARNDILIKCILMHLAKNVQNFQHSDISLVTLDPRLKPCWRDALEIGSFSITNKPLSKKRLRVQDDIWLITDHHTNEKSERIMIATTYLFTSPNAESIDTFLKEAYDNYVNLLTKQKDTRRYFLALHVHENKPQFKKYELDCTNTFDNLFFSEKNNLLQLVDSFQTKTGKFGIAGTSQKLGFLLSGLPGTGKTSIIKALASYTNRHIVNVSLSKIKTNQMLHDIMFDLKFNVGEELPLPMQFKDILFIFEDIDVSSNVSHSRDMQEDTNDEIEEVEIDSTVVKRLVYDKLNLSGLLNVLDGVIDSPDRMLVMTTNNVDILDEALIRPGRIDYKLHMKHMHSESIRNMLSHYFPGRVLPSKLTKELTAATVRQIICQHNYEECVELLFCP